MPLWGPPVYLVLGWVSLILRRQECLLLKVGVVPLTDWGCPSPSTVPRGLSCCW